MHDRKGCIVNCYLLLSSYIILERALHPDTATAVPFQSWNYFHLKIPYILYNMYVTGDLCLTVMVEKRSLMAAFINAIYPLVFYKDCPRKLNSVLISVVWMCSYIKAFYTPNIKTFAWNNNIQIYRVFSNSKVVDVCPKTIWIYVVQFFRWPVWKSQKLVYKKR